MQTISGAGVVVEHKPFAVIDLCWTVGAGLRVELSGDDKRTQENSLQQLSFEV